MIQVFETVAQMRAAAAWLFVRHAQENRSGFISVATGNTTTPIHENIAALYRTVPFDTSRLRLCCVDDYVGIEPGHIASCAERVRRQLVQPLALKVEQVLLPDQLHSDTQHIAAEYERQLQAGGGIRLQLLGLGTDSHLGFCRPGTPLSSTAHAVRLPQDTRDMLRTRYGLEVLPTWGVTLGLKSILHAKQIVIFAEGAAKAEAVHAALCGDVTDRVPASALQLHPNVIWMLDWAAAALLPKRKLTEDCL